jgi:ELWxxDGT repeat protein
MQTPSAVLAFGCLGLAPVAAAVVPAANGSLVWDLGLSDGSEIWLGAPGGLETVGPRVFAFAGQHALWTSDGTIPGTRVIDDLCNARGCGEMGILGAVGEHFLYVVRTSQAGSLVMATDGTEGGTRVVGHGIGVSVSPPVGPTAGQWARHGDTMMWPEVVGDATSQLIAWRDGERHVLLEVAGYLSLFDLGDRVVVQGADGSGSSWRRWETDGTEAGTRFLGNASWSLDPQGIAVGGRWVGQTPIDGWEVMASEGPPASDRALTEYHTPNPFLWHQGQQHVVRGEHVYWTAWDTLTGWELWRTDGTPGGTTMISDFPFADALAQTEMRQVVELDGAALFVATDGLTPCSVWIAAPPAAPRHLDDTCPSHLETVPGGVLWGDGYPPPTVRGLVSGNSVAAPLVGCPAPCDLQLDRSQTISGRTWVPSQSHGLVEIGSGRVLGVRPLWPVGQPWYARAGGRSFALIDPSRTEGFDSQLVVLDQALGVQGVLASFARRSTSSSPEDLATAGDRVWFSTCSGFSSLRYWTSDGTSEGTFGLPLAPVSCFNRALVPLAGGRAVAVDSEAGGVLRGFTANTAEILGIDGGAGSLVRGGEDVAVVVSTREGLGDALFRTDGTAAGTSLLVEFPGAASVGPMISTGEGVIAAVYHDQGSELYWIDTTTGSVLALGISGYEPLAAVMHQGRLHFIAVSRGGGEAAAFRIEANGSVTALGTATAPVIPSWSRAFSTSEGVLVVSSEPFGAHLISIGAEGVSSVRPGSTSLFLPGEVAIAAQVGSRVVFVASDQEAGLELWSTDGSLGGADRLVDLFPGPISSSPMAFHAAGGLVYFSADDGRHGRELWVTDGTPGGTRLLQDIAPGPAGSDPRELVATDERLYFAADDGTSGRELWSLPLAAEDCVPGEFGLCLGSQFRAEIEWRDFSGGVGRGTPVTLTADSGAFWFFNEANIESIVKVLDGRALNQHWWTFFGSLTNVDFALTVTDVTSGAARRWINPSGNFASAGDTEAFGPRGASSEKALDPENVTVSQTGRGHSSVVVEQGAAAPCVPNGFRLCLNGGRFAVEASWMDFDGNSGVGAVRPISSDTGAFWFFDSENLEVLVKVLDGRALNGAFWVFYGAISNVEYELVVTDSETGEIRRYRNPEGSFASRGDTSAFPQ